MIFPFVFRILYKLPCTSLCDSGKCALYSFERESQLFINIRWPPRDLTALRSNIFTVVSSLFFFSLATSPSIVLPPAGSIQISVRLVRAQNEESIFCNFQSSAKLRDRKHFTLFSVLLEVSHTMVHTLMSNSRARWQNIIRFLYSFTKFIWIRILL